VIPNDHYEKAAALLESEPLKAEHVMESIAHSIAGLLRLEIGRAHS